MDPQLFLPSENMPFSLKFSEKSAFPLLTLPSFRSLDSPFFNFKPKKSLFPLSSWFKPLSALTPIDKNKLLFNMNSNSNMNDKNKIPSTVYPTSNNNNNSSTTNLGNSNNPLSYGKDEKKEKYKHFLSVSISDKSTKISPIQNENNMNLSPKYKERKKIKQVTFGDDMWGMDREEFEENFSPKYEPKEKQFNYINPGINGLLAPSRSPKSPRRSPDRRSFKQFEGQNIEKTNPITPRSPRKSIVINNKTAGDNKVKGRVEKRRVSIKMKKEEIVNKQKRRAQLQLNYLKSAYEKEKDWSEEKIKGISGLTGLSENQIKTWFKRTAENKNKNMNFSEYCLLSFK